MENWKKINYFVIEHEHGQGVGRYYSIQKDTVNVEAETIEDAIKKFNEHVAQGDYKSTFKILNIQKAEICFIF